MRTSIDSSEIPNLSSMPSTDLALRLLYTEINARE